jgi:hypothetical protein
VNSTGSSSYARLKGNQNLASFSEIERSAREQFRLPGRTHDVQNWLPEQKEFELALPSE